MKDQNCPVETKINPSIFDSQLAKLVGILLGFCATGAAAYNHLEIDYKILKHEKDYSEIIMDKLSDIQNGINANRFQIENLDKRLEKIEPK